MLLWSVVGSFVLSQASYLLGSLTFLLIPCWYLLVLDEDRAMFSNGDPLFALYTISLLVFIVFTAPFLVKSSALPVPEHSQTFFAL